MVISRNSKIMSIKLYTSTQGAGFLRSELEAPPPGVKV